jgi:hypothetical protein
MTVGTAVEIVGLLALMGHLPPFLVVGIGYRVATIKETRSWVCESRSLT